MENIARSKMTTLEQIRKLCAILVILTFDFTQASAQKEKLLVSIENESNKKLYSFYYNHLRVVSTKGTRLALKSKTCEIIDNGQNDFYVRVLTNDVYVTLYVLSRTEVIDSLSFEVEFNIPLPQIWLSGMKRGGINMNLPRELTTLTYYYPFGDPNNQKLKIQINSFVVEMLLEDERYTEHVILNRFSDRVRAIYLRMKVNDTLIIRALTYTDDLGHVYAVPETRFVVQ